MRTNHSLLKTKGLTKCCTLAGIMSIMGISGVFAAPMPTADTTYLQVVETDSTQVLFPVIDKPVITLEENTVVVSSDTQSYTAEVSKVIDFSFLDKAASALVSISTNESGIEVSDNSVIVKGVLQGEVVNLYTVSGMPVCSYNADGGLVIIDLDKLSNGVYILSTKNANYKIKK